MLENNQLDCSYLVSAKYGTYPEYHTNKDNYSVFSEDNFNFQLRIYKEFIERLEQQRYPKTITKNEPMLSLLGLYEHISDARRYCNNDIVDFLYLCDEKGSLRSKD